MQRTNLLITVLKIILLMVCTIRNNAIQITKILPYLISAILEDLWDTSNVLFIAPCKQGFIMDQCGCKFELFH
jgi:hypothetical protein